MAELNNPLFEDEKEFLERQKLEYERALLGDVDNIKEKTQQVGKIALIGAGLVGSIWLISKAFRSKKSSHDDLDAPRSKRQLKQAKKTRAKAPVPVANTHGATSDDLGFGAGSHSFDRGNVAHNRAHIAPDVYHTDADPFPPLASDDARRFPQKSFASSAYSQPEASSIVASAFQSFMASDTGKMLIAQVTAVLMAYVAKKVGEYLPLDKNPDLAGTTTASAQEPETHDINFTYHTDADAPQQPL
ncbi:hypothetical protein [Hymenobacter sp. BT491]|uniref:hypothetical protein n=1 Tax=Hymenobacter sp. BT491 TaxID=2766779 RepID=UPI001653A015|nr:hypothetical protein [Hymenobacter sp. BT491]MBC6991709.1 hypothetical protein [Hymenobacter sp. BT491]